MSKFNYFLSKAKHYTGKVLRQKKYIFNPDIQEVINEIKTNGFYVINNFYSKEECKNLINEVDNVINIRKKNNTLWEDPYSSDKRCFGAEDESIMIAKFFNNKYCQALADNFYGAKMLCSNTLAGRIEFKKGNIGSGQGWHRDCNHLGFKAMVYLTDVEMKDGPFQILTGSHKTKSILKNIDVNKYDGVKLRFKNEEINNLIKLKVNKIKTFTATAGTIIFFDTSTLHSGRPLGEGGLRYALTNYYYPSFVDISARKEMFLNAYKKQ